MRTNIKKYIFYFLVCECGFYKSFFVALVNTSFQHHFYGFFSHHANFHFMLMLFNMLAVEMYYKQLLDEIELNY